MDKSWLKITNRASTEYIEGVDRFLNWACSQPGGDRIRCPCVKCRNTIFKYRREVRFHLFKNGMLSSYKCWEYHGEKFEEESEEDVSEGNDVSCDMIRDAGGFMNMDSGDFGDRGDVGKAEGTTNIPSGGVPQPPNPDQLQDLVGQQLEEGSSQITSDEMLCQVLGLRSGYFRGKGVEKKAPTDFLLLVLAKQLESQKKIEELQKKLDVVKKSIEAHQEQMRAEQQAQREEMRAEFDTMLQA